MPSDGPATQASTANITQRQQQAAPATSRGQQQQQRALGRGGQGQAPPTRSHTSMQQQQQETVGGARPAAGALSASVASAPSAQRTGARTLANTGTSAESTGSVGVSGGGNRRAPPPPPLALKNSAARAPPPPQQAKHQAQPPPVAERRQSAAATAQATTSRQRPLGMAARSESTRRLVDDLEGTAVESRAGSQADLLASNCDTSPGVGQTAVVDGAPAGHSAEPTDDAAGCFGGRATKGLLTRNLVWAVLASAVGSSFQHGYNGGVVNAPERLIGDFVNATYKQRHGSWASDTQVDLVIAFIVSIFCVGGCLGALLTAFVADRIGRKEGLMYNNLLVLIACPLMASARPMASYELLILGRFIIGLNAGLNAGLAPLYLNEIAPVQLRGALGTIYQLVITISILMSNIFGLPSLFGDESSWPILFALPILPAVFMLATLPHLCESPKHLLLNQGKELQAQQALAWLRQTGDVQDEIEELRNERELNLLINNRSIKLADMLAESSLRRPLTIAIVIMLSQQFSGINAVLFFSTSIFRDAGLGEHSAVQATLGMGVVNVAMTLVSLFLVDRLGRRTLHMSGLMGMAGASLVLALCLNTKTASDQYYSPLSSSLAVVAIYVFIAMFASGPGAIPWFLVAELFPSNARPLASSIAVAVNWLANFTVSLCFLPLINMLHGFTFVLFAILLVIFYLFTYYKVPETKGASAEEISALFRRH